MSDDFSRRVINLVGSVKQVVRDAPSAATAMREEVDAALREFDDATRRTQEGLKRDLRPVTMQRNLEFAYLRMPGRFGARMNRGSARPAVGTVETLRVEYDALLARTTATVSDLVAAAEQWAKKSRPRRMFATSSRPELPPQTLFDDIATLIGWAEPLVDGERAALRQRAEQQRAAIRDQGSSRIDSLMLAQSTRLDELRAELAATVRSGGMTIAPWSDPRWSNPGEPSALPSDLRIGEYEVKAPASSGSWQAPATISFPFSTGLVVDQDTNSRKAAIELARSLCVRLLATVPAGNLRFTFIDPVSLGQSVAEFQHLADFDPELVDTRPVTGARDIESRLADLSAHIETVISKYLRGQFDSIDAYNAVAGELAEPYRVLVVFDYPAGFNDSAAQQLLSLIENGPRCGLHTIVLADEGREQPRDLPLERLRHGQQRITWAGPRGRVTMADPIGAVAHDVVVDVSPPITFNAEGAALSPFAKLIVHVGEGSRAVGTEAVTLDRLLPVLGRMTVAGRSHAIPQMPAGAASLTSEPQTWWTASSAKGTVAPLGRSGAQDVTSLYFSSTEIAGGAIMVGLPRSGKTTSLHSAILTMCMLYSPEELELFLIDAKHGVEFKIYEDLPHARMVSIHSEREFSVALLRSIDQEIERRAELMKSRTAGRANISEYRAATGEAMPRIVLIMDEFHEIFEEDDQLGHEAFQAFSNIIRQGPFAGVHVVAASQTLSSMPALDRPTLQLLPERVAFMCNDTDADLVMGDLNRGTRLLTKQGQGLFNPARGEPSQNKPFQGLFIHPDQRDVILTQIDDLARARSWSRHPRVFDGDASAVRPVIEAAVEPSKRPIIPVGEPFTLQPTVSLTLRRSRGSNVALVGDVDEDAVTDFSARGALHSCVVAAVKSGARVRLLDFIGDEVVGPYASVTDLCHAAGADYYRGREFAAVFADVATSVGKRLADGEYSATTELVILFGVQRALSMKPADQYDDSPDAQSAAQLAQVIRDGPEVGIHTIVAADSASSLDRRIGSDIFGEFALRIGGAACSPVDLQFITGSFSTPPEVRRHQLVLGDHQRGSTIRMRAYPPLTQAELSGLGSRP